MSQGSFAEMPSTARCLSTFDEPEKRRQLFFSNSFYLLIICLGRSSKTYLNIYKIKEQLEMDTND